MLVSRRSLIIGAASSLLAAPALVKASSLDAVLRGDDMDPWVIAYRPTPTSGDNLSIFNRLSNALDASLPSGWDQLSLGKKVAWLNRKDYSYMKSDPKYKPWSVVRKAQLIPRRCKKC